MQEISKKVTVEIVCAQESWSPDKKNAGYPYPALTHKQQLSVFTFVLYFKSK